MTIIQMNSFGREKGQPEPAGAGIWGIELLYSNRTPFDIYRKIFSDVFGKSHEQTNLLLAELARNRKVYVRVESHDIAETKAQIISKYIAYQRHELELSAQPEFVEIDGGCDV
jgi:hypothetical protein